ncbi:DMT family transporter [Paracoccaceae bacterium GXU_MW_L88]
MQSEATDNQNHSAGILMMSVGILFLCLNDALAKTLTERYAPIQIIFIRNLISTPVALLIAYKMGGASALRSRRIGIHIIRAVVWVTATVLFFSSLMFLELAEATALIFVAPLFITAIAALFFGEEVGWARWTAVVVGFLGVLIIVRPSGATFQLASLLPIATALFYAILMLSARWVDRGDSVWTLMLYSTGLSAVICAAITPFFWTALRLEDLWLFAAIALCGTLGITMMTQAFRMAPAVVIAPLEYSSLLWATLIGWLVWAEIPDAATYLGAAVIIGSGLLILYRERAARRAVRGAVRPSKS